MTTKIFTPGTEEVLDAEAQEVSDALLFSNALEMADQDWVKDMKIDVPLLLSLKRHGWIVSDPESWVDWMRKHFWGIRTGALDLVIRFILKEDRRPAALHNGEHDLIGHGPDYWLQDAGEDIKLRAIPFGKDDFYYSPVPIDYANRSAYFAKVMNNGLGRRWLDRLARPEPCEFCSK